jgi:hypothetical protein
MFPRLQVITAMILVSFSVVAMDPHPDPDRKGNPSQNPIVRRNRKHKCVNIACDRCRIKRIKCDNNKTCYNCEKNFKQCVRPLTRGTRKSAKKYSEYEIYLTYDNSDLPYPHFHSDKDGSFSDDTVQQSIPGPAKSDSRSTCPSQKLPSLSDLGLLDLANRLPPHNAFAQ